MCHCGDVWVCASMQYWVHYLNVIIGVWWGPWSNEVSMWRTGGTMNNTQHSWPHTFPHPEYRMMTISQLLEIQHQLQMRVAVESLINDHVCPLNHRARLWEEIHSRQSCFPATGKRLYISHFWWARIWRFDFGVKCWAWTASSWWISIKKGNMKIHALLITSCESRPLRNGLIFRAAAVATYNFLKLNWLLLFFYRIF